MSAKIGITCGGDHWQAADIRSVEEFGYHSFWTGEHIVYHRPILEAVTTLAWAAALTSRIKIGPATLLLPLRHPTMVAKQFSCLDVLSGGRVLLTVGVGGDYPREFAGCGVPINERGQRSTEAIEIMRQYWSGKRFDYKGKIFDLADVDMLPRPVNGTIPIWVSGRQEGPMRRAAKLGDGWHPYMYTADRCRDSFTQVKQFAREGGRELPADYVFACFIYVALDDDVAKARASGVKELSYRYDQDFAQLVEKYCAFGPPARITEYLAKYVEAGANYLILAPIMPPNDRRRHLERLAREVMPALDQIAPGRVS
ncbi:MAG: LLM class flavin-dependent oxidoreductase [Alphaproteobacteria bacterium]|nr:LLM class flavin-dependent oxidoreductase [Alphaproteobacteria bacterium]